MKTIRVWLACSGLVFAACEADHDVVGELTAGAPATGAAGTSNAGAKSGVESTPVDSTRGGASSSGATAQVGGSASVGGTYPTGGSMTSTGGKAMGATASTSLGSAHTGGTNTTSVGSNGSSTTSGGQTHQQTLTGGQTNGGSAGQSSTAGAGSVGGSTATECGGPTAAKCPAGQFCDLASDCGRIPNATGICFPSNVSCTAQVDPVCGCDGVTYSNGCVRGVAGALKFADGACGSTAAYPTAYLVWQAPGGVAGTGPAVIVSGAGWADTWTSVTGFEPEMPPSSATGNLTLTKTQTDSLFARLAAVDWESLPHPTTSWIECYPELYLRLCSDCTARTLSYNMPSQLLPEMESVWDLFDTLLGSTAPNPRRYCDF